MYIISPWRIGHLTYRLKSLTNWRFAVGSGQTFVEEILVSYLWLFWLKSELQFCKKISHVSCKVNVWCVWSFRVKIKVWPYFSPNNFGKFCSFLWSDRCFLFLVKNWPCSLWVEILVNFTFRSDQTFVMQIVAS